MTFSVIGANAENTAKTVILGGTPFGLKIFTNGVIVIKVNDTDSPAKKAGIKVNDLIIKANDNEIKSNEDLKAIIENSDGKSINLTIKRDDDVFVKSIVPQFEQNNNYTIGMWIRDSTAGIGTITYFEEESKRFAALGHGICDKDTNMLMPLRDGEILGATISNCSKGADGVIGCLNGYFDNETIGEITDNNAYGIYGNYEYTDSTRVIQVADEKDVSTGKATIYSTIDGCTPKEYDVEITRLNLDENSGQNMIIKVTDEELLDKTGGIIQGMSGSPIIQNGKLVGAVTHVFVNSPEKGYGIFVDNMLNATAN